MLFNSPIYGAFLLFTYVGFWALRRQSFFRPLFLVVASYVFYFVGTYDAATEQDVPLGPLGWTLLCVGIIFFGSSLDFAVGKALGRTENPTKRKALLLASVVYYLGVLSVFKYFNFAADSVATIASWVGVPLSPTHLRLVLPFGISFFTFETMSYTIDVYRRELPPADRYLDYLLFVCFFPHLVAGPIVRPSSMLPQLAAEPTASDAQKAEGLFLIATGLLKKVVIGDTLGLNLVNRVFDNPERYSSLEVLVGVYAYAIKIYADFSGYSDVAIGSAKLFGYELPRNFDAPYTSADLQEFWRRWHISLSSWLRDYLYIPLGGNRHGPARTYTALMVTMLLGGLWHGASWAFVVWGGLHGLYLGVERALRGRFSQYRPGPLMLLLIALLTYALINITWVFFRAHGFDKALLVLKGMFGLNAAAVPILPTVHLVMVTLIVGSIVFAHWQMRGQTLESAVARSPALLLSGLLGVMAFLIVIAQGTGNAFIYFQF